MAHPDTIAQSRLSTREEQRQEANAKICDFANSHQEHISSADVKNGQGLIVIYALNELKERFPTRQGFTPYKIADFIRRKKLWFKLSIKEEGGTYIVGSGSLEPYVDEIDGLKQHTMYAEDKVMHSGRSRISNLIMNKIKGNVISPTRAHDLIRRLIDCNDQITYSVYFPRYLPPSNLTAERSMELNHILFKPSLTIHPTTKAHFRALFKELSIDASELRGIRAYKQAYESYQRDQEFLECW